MISQSTVHLWKYIRTGQPRLQTSALLQSPREETTGSRPEERLEEELSMTAGESGPAGGLTQSTSFKSRVSARRSPTPRSKRSVITRLPAAEGFLSAAPHCPCGETERETAKPVSLRGSTQVQFSSYRPTVALRAAAMRVFASRMQCESSVAREQGAAVRAADWTTGGRGPLAGSPAVKVNRRVLP
ncbi:Hypothetical protein SMAX5B_012013 [Scophthalmus maximus]|uniref:Uncharacterized protein n=1 Tax=Scophthalmus maximus TaxID=52904 RepID=A0A2U9AZ40_SCOMX|nr:Hypothetical protein SMAX5B_012013 [Scophthalmus maximus]